MKNKIVKFLLLIPFILIFFTACTTSKKVVQVIFEDETFIYDGNPHSLEISGDLPEGVTVTYSNNNQIDVGEYEVTATFTSTTGKYKVPDPLKAKLTITPKLIEGITFLDQEIEYDGNPHSLEISGDLPEGVTVTYSNNNQIDVGEYEVTATFTSTTGNYKVPDPLKAKLTIYNESIYYTIVFDFLDHQEKFEVLSGDVFSNVPSIPQKIGYEGAWDYDFKNPINSNLTLHIVYSLIDYKITYMLPEGISNNPRNINTYTYLSESINIYPLNEEIGMYFDGWYTSSSFTTDSRIYTIPAGSTGDIILYPKFINYRIESAEGFAFNFVDYELPALTMTVSNSRNLLTLSRNIIASEGCSWTLSKDIEGTNVIATKNISLQVGHNLAYITVWYNDEFNLVYILDVYRLDVFDYSFIVDNAIYKTDTVEEQSYIDPPASPTKRGYTFTNWVGDIPSLSVEFPYQINSDVIFYAVFVPNKYTITYDVNGGDALTETTQNVSYDSELELPIPTRVGYTFKGWKKTNGESFTDKLYQEIEDITLIADWEANEYTISYNGDGGSLVSDTQKVIYDSSYELYDITRTGYTFKGWYLANGEKYEATPLWNEIEDITLTAKWEANEYTISYYLEQELIHTHNVLFDSTFEIINETQGDYNIVNWIYDDTIYTSNSTHQYTFDSNINLKANEYVYNGTDFTLTACTDSTAEITGYVGTKSNVTIPNKIRYESIIYSITSIGYEAFSNCSSLTSITIPDSVTSIGSNAFSNCSSLTSITLPFVGASLNGTENTHFGYIFGASEYDYNSDYVPSSLKEVVITGETSIGSSAFSNCSSLTNVIIGNSVTSIGSSAFSNCNSLTSITLPFVGASLNGTENTHFGYIFGASEYDYNSDYVPSSLKEVIITGGTSIGNSAFLGCSSLASITIPNSVTSIGNSAFTGCSSLANVYYEGTIEDWCHIAFNNYSSNPMYYASHFYIRNSNNEWEEVTSIEIPNTITEMGAYQFYGFSNVTSITISDSVTSIGNSAFEDCSNLTDVTIGNSVTSINWSAFRGCSSLTNVYYEGTIEDWCNGTIVFPSSNSNHFYIRNSNNEWEEVTSIEIPNTITEIGDGQFSGFNNVTSITIPDSVTSIGSSAFWGCSSLASIIIPNNVTSIGSSAFSNCSNLTDVTIGNSVTSINWSAFLGCSSLTNVYYEGTMEDWYNGTITGDIVFPSSNSNHFYIRNSNNEWEEVTSIEIPNTITEIGDGQFSGFNNVTSITIPDSVTSIGEFAFRGCSSLTSITIPTSVTSISSGAFSSCKSLASIIIPNNVTSIGSSAFSWCSSLTSIVMPDSVTSIGDRTFSGCGSLTSITIPNSVTSIGESAFSYCESLASITIPTSVTSIGYEAFCECSSLTSIVIPDSVTSIGVFAFSWCSSLTIYCEAPSVPSNWDTKWNYSNRPVYWYSETKPTTSGNYWHYVDGIVTKW